ncbi:MAG TPA: O-unit flippase-like protein [Mucilaginibacter sp.]|nr:O-unit flippase-like protein [Mucilaginibacter sp.]
MQIGRKDILWNYAATFLKITSSVLLIPLILKMMPTDMVGIWTVFMTITSFAALLDFGFNPSFTRNVTYIFSGVKALKTTGFEPVQIDDASVDYSLLKGVIAAMRWLYLRMALVLFLLLASLGTWYIHSILQNYKGSHQEVYIAWALLCVINTYNIFTLYYDSLLEGKGLIKRAKQIVIIGQLVYLIIAALMIICHYGLIAIVSAQMSSVVIIRWLSSRSFFTTEIKQQLDVEESASKREVLRLIYPNALKIGLTSFGGFMVQKSAIIIGALYLTLKEIASYGISMQIIAVIAALSNIYISTYQPKIAHLRVSKSIPAIRDIYFKGLIVLLLTYLIGATGLLFMGNWFLGLIGSKTLLMPFRFLSLALVLSLVETNLSMAGNILLTKNEVPFFKASILSGFCTIIGLFIAFTYLKLGFVSMIIVPLVIDLAYQGWKWPWEVVKDLNIRPRIVALNIAKIKL